MSAELDAVETVPQQRLLGVSTAERCAHHGDPLPDGATLHGDLGAGGGGAIGPTVRDQMPRPLAVIGMGRVLAISQQLVSNLTGGEQFPVVALVIDADQSSTPVRIGFDQVVVALDDVAFLQGPTTLGHVCGQQPVDPVADGGNILGAENDRRPRDRTVGVERHRIDDAIDRHPGHIAHLDTRSQSELELDSESCQVGAARSGRIEDSHRSPLPGGVDSEPRCAPSAASRTPRPSSHASRHPPTRSKYT